MKLAKMSLVAALALGANAYAIDNVKVNGDARLYYQTEDRSTDGVANQPDMFDQAASAGDVALHLGLTADLTEGVSAGVSMTAVSTLGIENNLVGNTWSAAHRGTANNSAGKTVLPINNGAVQVDDETWFDEVWIAGTVGKTTAKAGRQALDTPLVFTETWGIDTNTFEAAVLMNQDLPETTLVATYIGKSNGSATAVEAQQGHGVAGYVVNGADFNSFYNGAYAFGAVNNSFEPLTAQAWYYDLQTVATAYWLQADLDIEGILAGVQYVNIDADVADDDEAYGLMLGYAMKDVATVKVAYSSVDEKGALGGVSNTATGGVTGAQSKLYTEMWWNYGNVSATGADSFAITAEGTAAGVDLFAGYFMADIDPLGTANDKEVTEITLTAGKDFGPLNATAALIFDDIDYDAAGSADTDATTLQIYLTYNF